MDGLLMEWGNHIGTGPGSQMGELSMMPIGQVQTGLKPGVAKKCT